MVKQRFNGVEVEKFMLVFGDEGVRIVDTQHDKELYAIDIVELLNTLSEENEHLRQILKDIIAITDETYTKNTSVYKVTAVFDNEKYREIKRAVYK